MSEKKQDTSFEKQYLTYVDNFDECVDLYVPTTDNYIRIRITSDRNDTVELDMEELEELGKRLIEIAKENK